MSSTEKDEFGETAVHVQNLDTQIATLRTQLKKSYNSLVATRDILTNLSFKGEFEKNLPEADGFSQVGSKPISECLKQLKEEKIPMKLPGMQTFCDTLVSLDREIQDIKGHHGVLDALGKTASSEMENLSEGIKRNQAELEKIRLSIENE